MTSAPRIDIADLIDRKPWTSYQKFLTSLAALAVIFDGFDIQILSFAIPALIADWKVTRADFGPVLALGLAGMAIGGPLAGYIGDRWGRRPALIGSVTLFGLCTVLTAFVHGIPMLMVVRFLTGLGAGGAVPNAGALAAEFAPMSRRPAAVKLTIVCIPLGGMIGGLIAAQVLPAFGWRTLYLIGGSAPLFFALVLAFVLPESPRFLARHERSWPSLRRLLTRMGHQAPDACLFEDRAEEVHGSHGHRNVSVKALFQGELARNSTGLWIAFFFMTACIYLVFGWLPTLLTAQGLSMPAAISGLSAYNFGGVLGVFVWTALMVRWGSRGPLLAGAIAVGLSAAVLVATPIDPVLLSAALALHGFLANAVQTSLFALAAHVYPTSVRASGVAYGASIGRTGALLTSFYGAVLIQAGPSAYWLSITAASICVWAGLAWIQRHIPKPE
jgi:AAHS family 4-hydroxybenzoate transporter-like MFS transporter